MFSGRSKWFRFGCDWWPWTKPVYITLARRQSNNQWSDVIAAHPATKYYECKKPLGIFSPRFSWIKTASSSWIISQKGKNQRGVLLIPAGAIEGHFEGKKMQDVHQGSLVLARQFPVSPGTRNAEETGLSGFPVSRSHALFSGSGPVGPRLTRELKNSPFFFRSVGHCCFGDLVGRTNFWIIWVACKFRTTG